MKTDTASTRRQALATLKAKPKTTAARDATPKQKSTSSVPAQPEAARARAFFPAPADPVAQIKARAVADLAMRPSSNSAAVIEEFAKSPFGEQDIWAISEELKEAMDRVVSGDLSQCETMLMGQALALQQMFSHLSRRVLSQEHQRHFEAFFAMALKAQNQCRMTLETLNELKHPRQSTFVRAGQANIANGPQQVNNGAAPEDISSRARASETEISPSKLLEPVNE